MAIHDHRRHSPSLVLVSAGLLLFALLPWLTSADTDGTNLEKSGKMDTKCCRLKDQSEQCVAIDKCRGGEVSGRGDLLS